MSDNIFYTMLVHFVRHLKYCENRLQAYICKQKFRGKTPGSQLDKTCALSSQIDVCKILLSRASTPAEERLIRGREEIRGEGRGIEGENMPVT